MATVTLPNYLQSLPIFNPEEILGANPFPQRFVTLQIAANQNVGINPNNAFLLPIGSILGLATSGANNGKALLWSSAASDGSQVIYGVLYQSVDTSQGVQGAAVIIEGNLLQSKMIAASGTTVPAAGTFLGTTRIQLEASIAPGAPF